MTSPLVLRAIDGEGKLGPVVGRVTIRDDEAVPEGRAGSVAADIVRGVALRRQVSVARAAELIADEPYGNQKIVLQAERISARRRRQLLAYDPNQPRDDEGKFAESPLTKARNMLIEQLKAVPGARDDHIFDPGGEGDTERPWASWEDAADGLFPTRNMEWNTNARDDDTQETVSFGTSHDERQQLATALGTTLMRDEGVPSDNPLVASVLLAGAHGSVIFGENEDIEESGRYIDWSSRDKETGNYKFEVGTNEDTIMFELTPDELKTLHASLVLSLLEDDKR